MKSLKGLYAELRNPAYVKFTRNHINSQMAVIEDYQSRKETLGAEKISAGQPSQFSG